MHDENRRNADAGRIRGTLLGGALVAFVFMGFGAYIFAAGGDRPKPGAAPQISGHVICTTPDNSGQHEIPPPVAPSATE